MSVFTSREIEDHKRESGKNGASIEKTSDPFGSIFSKLTIETLQQDVKYVQS